MTKTPIILALTIGTLACGPSPEDAIDRAEFGNIPEALALTVLSSSPDDARVFVGEVPGEIEAILPAASELPVLGGFLRGNGSGTVVFDVDTEPEAALSEFGARIEREGGERSPEDHPRGGSLTSPRSMAVTWCSGTHYARASSVTLGERRYLRVGFYQDPVNGTPCEHARRRAEMEVGSYGLHLPLLEPPAEADVQMSGGGGSSGGISMDALVVADLTAEEIFEHYVDEVQRHGWRGGTFAVSDRLAIGSWSVQDESGKPANGVLAVWRLGEQDNYRAMVRLDRSPADR